MIQRKRERADIVDIYTAAALVPRTGIRVNYGNSTDTPGNRDITRVCVSPVPLAVTAAPEPLVAVGPAGARDPLLAVRECTLLLPPVLRRRPVAEVVAADCRVEAAVRGVVDVAADEEVSTSTAGGRGRRRRSHGCRSALLGVMRALGSHSRHRFRKSTNSRSSQPRNTLVKEPEPGGPRILPRLERAPLRTTSPSA